MLKRLAVALAVFASVCPSEGRSQQQNKSQSVSSPTITAPQGVGSRQQQGASPEKPPAPHAGIEWSNWALVAVGILTFCAIFKQAVESANATKAMRDSIRLQESGMQQWVDVETVTAESPRREFGPSEPEFVVNLSFEAVNNTAYVLTIRKIETRIDMVPGESEVFTLKTTVTLPPRKESESNRYSFFVPAQNIKRESFLQGTTVTINGSITFTDCRGKTRSDYFGGLYDCGRSKFSKMKMLGIIPSRAVGEPTIPDMEGMDAAGNPWTGHSSRSNFWNRWRWQIWRSPNRSDSEDQDRPEKAN